MTAAEIRQLVVDQSAVARRFVSKNRKQIFWAVVVICVATVIYDKYIKEPKEPKTSK